MTFARRLSRRALLTGLALAPLTIVAGSAHSQAIPPQTRPQIVTSSVGEAVWVPDRAMLFFSVETRASTAAAAGAENAKLQTAVTTALQGRGVRSEHITTTGYSVGPNERYDNGQRKIVGYIARNTITVDVQRLAEVGSLIDTALSSGATSIGGLQYYATNMESVRRSALESAVKRARGDAEVMARAAGGTLGELIEVSVNDAGYARPMLQGVVVTGGAFAAERAPETPVSVGEQKISASVSARWVFVPGS